jgi:hypothetical protein
VIGWAGVGAGGLATYSALTLELMQTRVFGAPAPFEDPDVGWAVVGAGAAVLVGGLVLVLTNRHTTISQDIEAAAARPVVSLPF